MLRVRNLSHDTDWDGNVRSSLVWENAWCDLAFSDHDTSTPMLGKSSILTSLNSIHHVSLDEVSETIKLKGSEQSQGLKGDLLLAKRINDCL